MAHDVKTCELNTLLSKLEILTTFDLTQHLQLVIEARKKLQEIGLIEDVEYCLSRGLKFTTIRKIERIIGLALGNVTEDETSRYQLAVMLYLRDLYNVKDIYAYDPIFNDNDKMLLEELGVSVDDIDREGKYSVYDENADKLKTTLFFLPHCDWILLECLLWKNWNLDICNCVILTNSIGDYYNQFRHVWSSSSSKGIHDSSSSKGIHEHIMKAYPFTFEIRIDRPFENFEYYRIFSNISLHFFPLHLIDKNKDRLTKKYREPFLKEEKSASL